MAIIIALLISAILSIIFIFITRVYKNYLYNTYLAREKEEKEKSLDQLLDKYVVEEKKDLMKEKLSKISQIIAETEKEIEETVKKKVKVAHAQLKAKGKELEIIKQAKEQYFVFTAGLKSAMPETEKERLQDMAELKNAIEILESFDEEQYKVGPKKAHAGVGIFYDKMSRLFKKIISEQKLDEFKFIPVQRLKYHIFQSVKNIKNSDILPILNIMKDTQLLNDIIEINPTFHIIVFTDKKIKLTMPEKVLMTFAYDEDFLTIQKLQEITEWKKGYADRILNGLIKKGLIVILDENIRVEGFGHEDERKLWDKVIEEKIREEKLKEEAKRKRQEERAKLLKSQLRKVEEAKKEVLKKPQLEKQLTTEELIDSLDDISAVDKDIPLKKFGKKPSVKILPLPEKSGLAPELIKKEKQKIKDKDDLIGAMEALDELIPKKTSKMIKMEEEEPSLEDLIPEKILNFHEKFTLINGGFAQYEKIKEYVEKKIKNVPEELFKAMLSQLQELQMIHGKVKIGQKDFYLFNELKFDIFEKRFLQQAIEKEPLTKEDFMKVLKWDEEKTLKTMKKLQEKGILRIEQNKIIIPGIIQKS
ncbi:MAG: hypothetical protein ACTSQJ_10555 [Promethearchaeota archaeon]